MTIKTKTTRRTWTPDEEKQLAALTTSGVPKPDIAAQLDRSYHAVHQRQIHLRKTGIIPPVEKPERFTPEQLAELRVSPLSDYALAKKMGSTPGAVRWHRKKRDMSPPAPPGQQCQHANCRAKKVDDPHRLGLCAGHLANAQRILAHPAPSARLGEE